MALRRKVEDKVLDVDASMQGTLAFKDPVNLRINGSFEGTLDIKGSLTIGQTAIVNADINGDNIIIGGKVKGRIIARERLTLLPTAVVEGEIFPSKLNIAEGALFEGSCKMLQDFLNAEELARYLEVDLNSILDWASTGKLPGHKEGEKWQFERKNVDAWIAAGKIG
jgi:excisionase family DNA binding protein